MSWKLDGEIETSAPQSVLPSTATVDLSSVAKAIERIGQAVSQHDQTEDAIADKEAAEIEAEAMAAYEPERAERAARYTGEAPGYSASEIEAYDARVAEFRQMALPSRVQKQVNLRLDARRVKVSGDAIAWEAAKAGQLEGARRAAEEQADDARVLIDVAPQLQERMKALSDAWDGQSKGYAAGVAATYDETIQPIIDALPEGQKLRLQTVFAGQKSQLFAQAMAKESAGRDAYLLRTANEAASTAINMVQLDPEAYQTAGFLIDKASSSLPAAGQETFRKAAMQSVAMARIDAFVRSGNIEAAQAVAEREKGLLDSRDFDQALNLIQRGKEHKRATDYVAQAGINDQIAAYIDGVVASDNRAPRPDDATVRDVLGEKGLFEFRQKEAMAKGLQSKIGDFSALSTPEMAKRVQEISAEADKAGPDYEMRQGLKAAAAKAYQVEVEARTKDPARWAMTGNYGQKVVGGFWTAQMNAEPGRARVFSRRTYVQATTAQQADAGLSGVRILPGDVAKGMVTTLAKVAPEKRGDAMAALQLDLRDWGDARGQVISELKTAGLDNETALVLAEYDDPVKVAAFAQGAEAYKAMKPSAREKLTERVANEMRAFDATLAGPMGQSDRHAALARETAAYMEQGMGEGDAVRKATQAYKAGYIFFSTYRMPVSFENQKVETKSDNGLSTWTGTKRNAITLIVPRIKQDLINTPGAMSVNVAEDEMRRKQTAQGSRWVTLNDESGLALMYPDTMSGQWTTVKDKDGKPMSFTWDQLIQRWAEVYKPRH